MEEMITIERKLVKQYGFEKAMLIQFLKDSGNAWKGKMRELEDELYPISEYKIKNSILNLDHREVIMGSINGSEVRLALLPPKDLASKKMPLKEMIKAHKRFLKQNP